MKKIPMKIETFEVKGFYIDILTFKNIDFGDCYEAWIYDPRYGTKVLMFGAPKDQQSYEEFLEVVEYNVDEHIKFYKDHDWYEENLEVVEINVHRSEIND